MNVTQLPARTVTDAAAASTTPGATTVIDSARVHRDWWQLGAEAAGMATAVTAGTALYAGTFNQPALAWLLASTSGTASLACLAFLILMAREGRRWVYATDTDLP